MAQELLIVCAKCGKIPCFTTLMREELLSEGHRFLLNNDIRNSQAIFYLCRIFTRVVHSIFGGDNPPPPQVQRNFNKRELPK